MEGGREVNSAHTITSIASHRYLCVMPSELQGFRFFLSRQWFEVTEVPRVVGGDDCELDVYWKGNPHSQNQPRNIYLS